MTAHQVWTLIGPLAQQHRYLLLAIWGYLVVGACLALAVLWDAHRRNSRQARTWAWSVQLMPPFVLFYLLFRPRQKPLRTPFGEVVFLEDEGESEALKKRPFHLWEGLLGASLIPGLSQILLRRWFRTLGFWLLMALSVSLYALQVGDIRRSWEVPDRFLPDAKKGTKVTVNFRVPAWLGKVMLGELAALILVTYLDRIRLADAEIPQRLRNNRRPQAYYGLHITRTNGATEMRHVATESLVVGSKEDADVVVQGDGVLPHHATVYIHRNRPDYATLRLRCFEERATVLSGDTPVYETELQPGGRVRLGDAELEFLELPSEKRDAS